MRIKIRKPRRNEEVGRPPAVWPVAYRWAAVGTLVACSTMSERAVLMAQDVVRHNPASRPKLQLQGQQPVYRFDIPASSLDVVMAGFEQVTTVHVVLSSPAIGRLSSPGVIGVLTPEQALQRLLDGTGLSYRFTTPTDVRLDIPSVAQSVDVTASVDELAASSPKYSAPVLDTPQTITELSSRVIQDQGATTLRDTLRNVAGISLAAGEGSAQGDNLTIRGFTARNDLYIDGMRDFGSYYRDPFNTQEVEVLQGPSSVTFGRGSTGGVVNQATKMPSMTGFASGSIDVGTDLTRRGTLDVDRPFQIFGLQSAFRLNAMGNLNDVAEREVAENRRFGIAPALTIGLGSPTRLTLSYFHQNADDTPDYGIPWLFNGPAPVPRSNYYGFEHGNFLRTDDDIGTVRLEHDFANGITLREQARYANYGRDALITEPQVIVIATQAAPTYGTPLNAMAVNRHEIGVDSVETMLDDQLDLTARFKTGFLRHTLVTGVEGGKETSDPVRPTWTQVPTASLLNPNPEQELSGSVAITSIVHTTSLTAAAYALDTVQFGAKWEATAGARWDRFDTAYTQQVPPSSAFNQTDEMPSWRAALVYKPRSIASIYFDAGTSFNPSAESLSLSAATANLPPERNRTFELGTKWELGARHFSLRSSVFRTDKYAAREPDPNNPLLDVLAGNQSVKGADVQVNGRLTSRWDLLSSFAYLDSRVVSSPYYPAAIGSPLANVPRYTFNARSTYRLPKRWEVGVGANYESSRIASSTAPFDPATGLLKELPGYWVFNAMVKHPLNEHVDVQVNVNNIANRYYYDQLHPGHIVPGAGRAALIGFKFRL